MRRAHITQSPFRVQLLMMRAIGTVIKDQILTQCLFNIIHDEIMKGHPSNRGTSPCIVKHKNVIFFYERL